MHPKDFIRLAIANSYCNQVLLILVENTENILYLIKLLVIAHFRKKNNKELILHTIQV